MTIRHHVPGKPKGFQLRDPNGLVFGTEDNPIIFAGLCATWSKFPQLSLSPAELAQGEYSWIIKTGSYLKLNRIVTEYYLGRPINDTDTDWSGRISKYREYYYDPRNKEWQLCRIMGAELLSTKSNKSGILDAERLEKIMEIINKSSEFRLKVDQAELVEIQKVLSE